MGMIGNTLAQGLISGANIQDGTVDTADIKSNAITPSKLSIGGLTWDSSGNHGIGTAPSAKLHLLSTGATTADGVRLTFGSEARSHNIYSDLSTGRDLVVAPYRALTLLAGSGTTEGELRLKSYESTIFYTGSAYTERARIDPAGNFGVGVTPNSWASDWRMVQIGSLSSIGQYNATSSAILAYNYFNSGTNGSAPKYIANGSASVYQQAGLSHYWYSAPTNASGAGAAMTLATLMTLSNDGTANTTLDVAAQSVVNSTVKLRLSNTYYNYWDIINDSNLRFSRGGSEWLRMDNSGNLLVGSTSFTTGGISKTVVINGAGSSAVQFQLGGALAAYVYAFSGAGFRVETSSSYPVVQFAPGASGGVQLSSAGATSWSTLSDERTKTDLLPITNAVAKVTSLRAVTGRFHTDPEETRRSFLIAQDVQAVLPEAVSTYNIKDDETDYLGLSYTDTIPLLVAAIKEQQAIIEQMQTRLAALEGA